MDSLKAKLSDHIDSVKSGLDKYALLQTFERVTGVSKTWLAAGVGIATFCILFFGFGAPFLCNVVGFIYPVAMSFKTIETNAREEVVQWLTYWMIYAFFNLLECFTSLLLHWFPFYYAFKLGFLVYCFLPTTQGARFVYSTVIKPFFENHGAVMPPPQESRGRDRGLSDSQKKKQ